jgi:CRISPR-associated endonuclease/helicase Cas3
MTNENKFVAHVREKDKQIQTVYQHLIGTSEKSSKYADKIGMKEYGKIIGLFHDMGKATELFNSYIMSATGLMNSDDKYYMNSNEYKGKIDHSTAGAQYLYNSFSDNELIKQILFVIVKSHHGGLIDCITPDGRNIIHNSVNKDAKETRLGEATANIEREITNLPEINYKLDLRKILELKISIINREETANNRYFMIGLIIRFLFSCLIDADRTDTADFENPVEALKRFDGNYIEWNCLSYMLEEHLKKFKAIGDLNIIRKDISNTCLEFSSKKRGIYQLSVPTGGGKTLSSLRFSINHALKHKMDRIIYIVPFTTIIDQNADEVRKILENGVKKGSVVLEHHSNLTPEKETDSTKLLSENWDSPIIFTTMVQFLDTLFKGGTKSVRRMHQLANTIIIFDEIQTLDVKFVYIFNLAIKFLVEVCNSTILLCTATQPLLDEIEPSSFSLHIPTEFKIIKNIDELYYKLSRATLINNIRVEGWDSKQIIGLAARHLENSENVLIITNTKKSALDLMQLLDEDHYTKYHLSTSMCPEHRMDILTKMIKSMESENKEKPIICVSTQLIEAGVNIDFDVVIRFVAGLDSIVQAAGRCNRNGMNKEKGKVYVLNPNNENLDKLITIKRGKDITERIFNEFKNDSESFDRDLLGPKALRRYFQYYFYSRKDEMGYNVRLNEYGVSDNLYNLLSLNTKSVSANYSKSGDKIVLPFAFKTAGDYFKAIENNTYGVIVPYKEGIDIINELCSATYLHEKQALLRKAQRFSINIFGYQKDRLFEEKIIFETQKDSGVLYLDKTYYDDLVGLVIEAKMNDIIL